jgi:DNA end-binding protein Ku
MRGRDHLVAVHAADGVIELHTMHRSEEVRPARDVGTVPGDDEVSDRELEAARRLIELLSVPWQPEQYPDTYRSRVAELVEAKRAGRQVVVREGPPPPTEVVDLMEALRASLEQAGAAAGGAEQRGRRRAAPRQRGPERATRAALYRRASDLQIPGRSGMSREQLERAIATRERREAQLHAVS